MNTHVVTGLTNDTVYQLSLVATDSTGDRSDSAAAGWVDVTPSGRWLKPDPNLLTGLRVHDGTRELPISAVGNQVGLGDPHFNYWVYVNPGVHELTVTPIWTNPSITGVTATPYYYATGPDGPWGSEISWTTSGEEQEVPLVVNNVSFQGVTELKLRLGGVTHQPYVILLRHDFTWKSANKRLGWMELQIR